MEISSTINIKEYKIQKRIGCGTFGDVFQVKHEKSREIYAAKIIKKSIQTDFNDRLRDLSREVNILSTIKHPSVVVFIGFSSVDFNNEKNPVIITEILPNGSLYDVLSLERKGLSNFNWNMTRKLINIYGIASAMSFLHANKIIHRDLKPANILMDEFLCPKIADFGLSKKMHTNESSKIIGSTLDCKGTPLYMAPEIWSNAEYSTACDVYAFGIILYEILSTEEPFKELSMYDVRSQTLKGIRPKIDSSIPPSYTDLIQCCWAQNPADRPSFDEIVESLRSTEKNGFITELVEENDFWDYVDFIDNFKKIYDTKKRIIKIDQYIKNF